MIKIIEDLAAVKGKTVSAITTAEIRKHQVLCVQFTDDTAIIFGEGKEVMAVFSATAFDAQAKFDLGLITEEEFNAGKAAFDALKNDYMTVGDKLLIKARAIGW